MMSHFIRDIHYGGVIWEVEFNATPYIPATMYSANGDPGDPAEGGEVEVLRISVEDSLVDLTEFLDENIIDEITTRVEELDDLFDPEEL